MPTPAKTTGEFRDVSKLRLRIVETLRAHFIVDEKMTNGGRGRPAVEELADKIMQIVADE